MKGVFENRISNFTQCSTEYFFPIIGKKAKTSTFTSSVQHYKFYSLYQKINAIQFLKNKTVLVHRQHGLIYRTS